MYERLAVSVIYIIGCACCYFYGRYNGRREGFRVGFGSGVETGGKTILKILDSTGMLKDKSEATRAFTMAEVELSADGEPKVRIVNDESK